MKLINSINDIQQEVLKIRKKGLSVGFVPTMGALHQGHLSLLERSMAENDVSLVSIFVNPIQFNNKQDLKKYPRTLEDDVKKLERAGCDIVFAPSVAEMYPEEVRTTYDFGMLEKLMEGERRPGHFNGVAVVVKRLFDVCMPDKAYFGEKDFQQLSIIRELVKKENLSVEVAACPIIREYDGLAMSSRNVRLTKYERTIAPIIFHTLSQMKEGVQTLSVAQVLSEAKENLDQYPEIKIEYVQIVDENTLLAVNTWDEAQQIRAFVALFLGDVRLIDNMKMS
ncbi:MAG: pantoate--beta-alanine ligase [Bacteroidota bacterium]